MDILDNIEIADDAAGLKRKASLGEMRYDRRSREITLSLDIDTYKNIGGEYGDIITGDKTRDLTGRYDRYELTMTAKFGNYDLFNGLANGQINVKELIKAQVIKEFS